MPSLVSVVLICLVIIGLVCFILSLSKATEYQNNRDYSNSQIDVYNMRMLVNCLEELKEIRGGDTHVK